MRLVGTTSENIVRETRRVLGDRIARTAMARRAFPYGNGTAALQIAAIIEQWLESRCAVGLQLA